MATREASDQPGSSDAPSFVHVLRSRALRDPDRLAYTYLSDGVTEAVRLTIGDLDRQARSVATALQSLCPPGSSALLLYPPGPTYLAGFYGCLYAGVAAVPAYLPDLARLNQTLPRLQAIGADARAAVVMTTTELLAGARSLIAGSSEMSDIAWLGTDDLPPGAESGWREPALARQTVAMLQYTSGSTRTPRGVMLSHGNLLHNSELIRQAFQMTQDSVGVIWLPPYHDMGLIGGILQPMYVGCQCVLMPPAAFLQHPGLWLQAVSRYHAVVSGGPNFAFDLCVRKVKAEERATLDLSSWRVAFNGAEPVRAETLERFAETFAACGFRREAFFPCYGLAEATLIVSGGQVGAGPAFCAVDKTALEHHRVVPVAPGTRGSQLLTGSGRPLAGQDVVIVDQESVTTGLPDQVGEIWVSGPSVAQGYLNRPDDPTFRGRLAEVGDKTFLRTGDLGFLHDGELFVTGRIKDVIIIRGRNHYPQDIELTLEQSHPACRPGCGAAFSVAVDGEERLVVVQELDTRQTVNPVDVVYAMRRAVAQVHEVHIYAVLLIEPRTIPKTSSGKIQRHACRTRFIAGSLDVITASVQLETAPIGQSQSLTPAALLAAEPAQRQSLLVAYLQQEIALALRISPMQVRVDQPMDRLGADSVEMTDLIAKIETTFGIGVRISEALASLTLSQLAEQILRELVARPAGPIAAGPALAEYPLSHGQQALWFFHQLAPRTGAYNIVYAVRTSAELDPDALKRTVDRLVQRHPTLRTTFGSVQGAPVQRVHGAMPGCFIYETAEGMSPAELRSRLAQEVYYPYNLECGPLVRVVQLARGRHDHILVLGMHHVIGDLWSAAILLSELGAFYAAERTNQPLLLEPLKSSYADYVLAQARMIEGPEGEAHWQFWQQQLAGELPALNLATDRPRPAAQTFRGAYQTVQLGVDLTQRLEAIARTCDTSLHVTLLAAFQALLYRYTGQEDFLIGYPKAARSLQWSRLVGYFANVVPIRADLSGNPTFASLVERVRAGVSLAFAHDAYPFALLAERLQLQRDLSRPALFQVMFSWQKTISRIDQKGLSALALGQAGQMLRLHDLELEVLPLEDRAVPFDLSLLMTAVDGEAIGMLEYNTDLFDAATITRFLNNFATLLQGVVDDPEQPVARLPLLSPAERQLVLVDWNATETHDLPAPCIHLQFEARAARSPDSAATVLGPKQQTYRELNQGANQLAQYLRQLGVSPGACVAVFLTRTLEMPLALLAIMKAGGVYVPLEPEQPPERLGLMLADARVRVILTRQSLLNRLPAGHAEAICLDAEWDLIGRESTENLQTVTQRDDPAYVIYTSGTTGEPKGVQVSHGALADHCRDIRQFYQLVASDRVLQFAALSFDPSLEQILPTLIAGACVVLRGPELLDGRAFNQMVAEQAVTVVNVPPAYWQQWAQAWADGADLAPNKQLRVVIIGGDVMTPESLLLWRATPMRYARLLNAYGPTEATVTASTYQVPDRTDTLMIRQRIPIGRPLPNRKMYILDAHGSPVPIGVVGELYIGGAGLALGYLNHPELSAAKFVHSPFSVQPGARLYRTGDQARYLADGNIEFLGRLDDQVKIRGIRIELGEIRHVLGQHPAVRQVEVVLRDAARRASADHASAAGPPQHSRDKAIVAYIVPAAGKAPDGAELQSFLHDRLPTYMVPAAFVMLAAFPLNASGKVDYRALPAPAAASLEHATAYVAPRTPVEAEVARIWGEVLGSEPPGIYDDFFALGGHSLIATRLVARIREAFQVELPLRSLFEASTVAGMTVVIAQMQAEQYDSEEVSRMLDELEQLAPDQTADSMADQVN